MADRNCGVRTSVDDIIAHWVQKFEDFEFSVDLDDASNYCWRCAHKSRSLHKCHIVPHSLGGKDTPANLVLLCGRCHLENPNTDDIKFFWLWLKAHSKVSFAGCYDTYWTMRGVEEFKRIFGREPFVILNPEGCSQDDIQRAFKRLHGRVAKHFGENGLNASTMAWVMYKVENSLKRKSKQSGVKNLLSNGQGESASAAP